MIDAPALMRDITNAINGASLGRDVIDLLQTKCTLLVEEISILKEKVASLQLDKSVLASKLDKLTLEHSNLNAQYANLVQEYQFLEEKIKSKESQKGGLDEEAEQVLKFFFEIGRNISVIQVCGKFSF